MAGITEVPASHSPEEFPTPLSPEELRKMNAYWRACNYLAAGMIYLRANPLLREPLKAGAHQESAARPLGFGPGPELYLGSSQPADQEVRPEHDLPLGPGHGAPATLVQLLSRRSSTPRFIRTRARMRGHAQVLSSSFPFPAGSAATARRKHPARFTRAANSDTAFPTGLERRSTIPT